MTTKTTGARRALPGLFLALLLAVPTSLEAQVRPPRGMGPGTMGPAGPMGAARSAPRAELPRFALEHRAELGLSEEQAAALEALVEPMRAEARPLFREMQAVRERVRDGELDRAGARAEMEAIRERLQVVRSAHRARVLDVLTAEQRATFEELHQAGPRGGRAGPHARRGGRRGPRGGGGGPGPVG